jgi:hypothetical protein
MVAAEPEPRIVCLHHASPAAAGAKPRQGRQRPANRAFFFHIARPRNDDHDAGDQAGQPGDERPTILGRRTAIRRDEAERRAGATVMLWRMAAHRGAGSPSRVTALP